MHKNYNVWIRYMVTIIMTIYHDSILILAQDSIHDIPDSFDSKQIS